MPVDTTIQFNGHNTYRITTTFLCYPFGVQGMTHITHSFQAYATTIQAAQTRAKTKFLAADGTTISNVTHDFAIGTVFDKVEITVPVPVNAVSAQLILLRGTTDWWIAEPKSEYGEIATPYNVNYAGQLTYITPTGVYTGMLTTGQIVVAGSINQPTETLGTRLVTINNNLINLSATTASQGSRLTTIEAGQITLESRVDGVEPKITKLTADGVYTGEVRADQLTVGQIQGHQLANGSISDIKITSLHGSKIIADSISADKINTSDLTVKRIANPNDSLMYAEVGRVDESTSMLGLYRKFNAASTTFQKRFEIVSYANIATVINVPVRTSTEGEGSTVFYITHGDPRLTFWGQPGGGGSATLKSNDAEVVVDALSGVEMKHIGGTIGVDSTGPFYITNAGTKKYLT